MARSGALCVGLFRTALQLAEHLITNGNAYVDDLDAEQTREYRGTLTEPGRDSPFRDRSVDENLDLFQRMRAGEFPNGARTLRARIDMSSGNMNMRDPVLYRVLHETHPRTGNDWCIYPTYDFAHGQSDAIEGVNAFPVHVGIRRSSAIVRLADRAPADSVCAGTDRIRPAQPDPYHAVETKTDAAGQGRRGQRLG